MAKQPNKSDERHGKAGVQVKDPDVPAGTFNTPLAGGDVALKDAPKPGEPTALVDQSNPYGDDAGAGAENLGADEQLMPMIVIEQGLTPQVVARQPGHEPGLFLNTATGVTFRAFEFVAASRDHNYPCFTPREKGGGFHGIFAPDDPFVVKLIAEQGERKKLEYVDRDDQENPGPRELQETYYLFVLAVPVSLNDQLQIIERHGVPFPAVLPFKSTQIKKYKGFMSTISTALVYIGPTGNEIRPPMWAHRWLATTRPEKNKKGEYHGWSLDLAEKPRENALLKVTDALYKKARDLYTSIKSGKTRADYAAGEKDATDEASDPAL